MNYSRFLPNNLAKLGNKLLDSVNFSTDDNSKILRNLDQTKTHGHAHDEDQLIQTFLYRKYIKSSEKFVDLFYSQIEDRQEGKFRFHVHFKYIQQVQGYDRFGEIGY